MLLVEEFPNSWIGLNVLFYLYSDDMHSWTCRVVKKIGIGETDFLTLHPGMKSQKVKYDILATAVIVVVLKLLFLLDDEYEW